VASIRRISKLTRKSPQASVALSIVGRNSIHPCLGREGQGHAALPIAVHLNPLPLSKISPARHRTIHFGGMQRARHQTNRAYILVGSAFSEEPIRQVFGSGNQTKFKDNVTVEGRPWAKSIHAHPVACVVPGRLGLHRTPGPYRELVMRLENYTRPISPCL